jgi:hypothetical protein
MNRAKLQKTEEQVENTGNISDNLIVKASSEER